MKRAVVGFLSLVLMLAGVAAVTPFLLPKDTIRAELMAQLETRTGLRLRIDGSVGLSLVPGFRMTAEDVGVSRGTGPEFVAARAVDFGLAWEGLFGGDIRITHIGLVEPTIMLDAVQGDTVASSARGGFSTDRWTSATQAIAESNGEGAPAPLGEDASTSSGGSLLARVGIDRLTVSDGRSLYSDKRGGARYDVAIPDLELRLPVLTGPLDLAGSLMFQGLVIDVAGRVGAPLALGDGGESAVNLDLSAAGAEGTISGTLAPSATSQLSVAVEAGDLSAIVADMLDSAVSLVDLGEFSLTATVAAAPDDLRVSDLRIDALGGVVQGEAEVRLAGDVPDMTAALSMQGLGLERLLKIAGRPEQARGTIGGDMRLAARGGDAAMLLGTLNAAGRVTLQDGGVDGLPVTGALAALPGSDRIDALTLMLEVNGLDQPVALSGGFSWRDEAFRVSGAATPALVLAGLPTPLRLRMESAPVTAGYDGTASATGDLSGDFLLETGNLRGLAAWLGAPIADGGGLGPFSFSGGLDISDTLVRFAEAEISLDDTRGRGSGEIYLGGRPRLTATLELESLGLDPYLGGVASEGGGTVPTPRGNADAVSGGWSTERIDFSGLRALDADVTLSAGRIVWGDIEIGRSRVDLDLVDGRLAATLSEITLYEGTGQGRVTIEEAGGTAVLSASAQLSGVSARPFLLAAADFGWIEGRVETRFDITAEGASQAELVSNLDGSSGFAFTDGAILGLNIPRMVRGLTVDTLLGWSANADQKTDFSVLSAGFAITDGIASSSDLRLVGPLVRMNGAGQVNVPAKTLDWRLEPRVVADLGGGVPVPRDKGQEREFAGLGVPVIVRGSWDNPSIYPDIEGILQDPQAALKKLETLGGGLFKALEGQGGTTNLEAVANDAIERVTGGTSIDVQKVIEGDVDDQQVLDAVEQGFGLPSGFLGSFGLGNRPQAPADPQ